MTELIPKFSIVDTTSRESRELFICPYPHHITVAEWDANVAKGDIIPVVERTLEISEPSVPELMYATFPCLGLNATRHGDLQFQLYRQGVVTEVMHRPRITVGAYDKAKTNTNSVVGIAFDNADLITGEVLAQQILSMVPAERQSQLGISWHSPLYHKTIGQDIITFVLPAEVPFEQLAAEVEAHLQLFPNSHVVDEIHGRTGLDHHISMELPGLTAFCAQRARELARLV